MGGAAPSKIPENEEVRISPHKNPTLGEIDCSDPKLKSGELQTMAFGSEQKYREYPEIKKSKSNTLEWNDSGKLEIEEKSLTPVKPRIEAKQKPPPPSKPRPPPNRPQSIVNQPKVPIKSLPKSERENSLNRESQPKVTPIDSRRIDDINSTNHESREGQTPHHIQGGSRIISKIQQCVDGSSSDDENDSTTVYDWTLTQTQGPSTHPDIKLTQNLRENHVREIGTPKPLIRTVSDRDDEFIADFRNSDKVSDDFVKPDCVPMLNISEGSSTVSEFKHVSTFNHPPRVVLPPRVVQKSGPMMTGGPRGPIPVRGPAPIKTNTPVNRTAVTTSPNHYLISPLNRPPQEHHQVKETKDVKRNRAQIPSTLTHAKPTTGDWLKKRYIVNNYILLDLLGTGSYGEVKLCKDRTTDKLYAMKIFSKEMLKKRKGGNTSETYFEDIKREIAIMKKLSHPNVLKLFEVLDDPNVNKMYLVLEYMKRGDLIKFLKTRETPDDKESKESIKRKNSEKFVTLSDAELKVIFTQVVSGVKYLHYQNIIHGDIKPQNILVGDDNLVKIADFGISKMLENGSAQKLVDAGGTPAFMAPELCSSSEAFSGQLADIWAIGATMFMLRFGHPPFVASNVLALYNKIVNDPLEFPAVPIDPGLRNLLVNMLEKDPKLRYNMDQITSHPWLRFAPRPIASPFVHHPESSSMKSDKHILQLSDQYFNEEAQAMNCPKKTVDKEEIYRSIGYGVEQNQHQSEDSEEAVNAEKDDQEEEDIMATNWAADVFEQVDDADIDSDEDDSIDEDSTVQPTKNDELKSLDMDESEQDRRAKEFKQKLIAKSSASNFLSAGTTQNRSRPARIDSVDDETDDEFDSPQRTKIGHRESLELGDLVEELSMNDFEEMMDTLAMRPVSRVSQPPQPTNVPFLLENVIINSHSINVRNGLGGVVYSDQGCRRSQEDCAVLLLNFDKESQLAAESGHYEQLLNISVAAVFDGHSGERCSNFLASNFVRCMVINQHFYSGKMLKQSMIETCREMDAQVCQELKTMNDSSGSTGVVVAYDGRSRRLTVANVGDSKCILCRNGSAVSIHRTHRVGDHEDEIIRIKGAGGSVVNKRVNGVLAISRAFGDTAFKDDIKHESSLVIATPEVYSEIVTPMTEFCVIASDGLWDVMEPQAVVNYIRDRINGRLEVETVVQDLVNEAIEIGSIDNVTVIILIFHLDKISPTVCSLPTIDSISNLQSVKTVS